MYNYNTSKHNIVIIARKGKDGPLCERYFIDALYMRPCLCCWWSDIIRAVRKGRKKAVGVAQNRRSSADLERRWKGKREGNQKKAITSIQMGPDMKRQGQKTNATSGNGECAFKLDLNEKYHRNPLKDNPLTYMKGGLWKTQPRCSRGPQIQDQEWSSPTPQLSSDAAPL